MPELKGIRERIEVAVAALFGGRDVIGEKAIEAMKGSNGGVRSTQIIGVDRAVAPETRLEPLIKNGWRKNELIYACVSKKANTASQTRLMVVRKKSETELPNHPLRTLLQRPNKFMTESNFYTAIIILQDFAGNCYFEKVRSRAGRTVELWPVRPDWMKAHLDSTGMQTGWVYTPPGLSPHFFELVDILSIRLWDPLNEYFGYPPVAVAARVGDLDNGMTDYVRMVFEKGGIPPGILTSTQPITDAIADRIRALWREKYGGVTNWDAPVILGHDTKYQSTGLSFQQLGMDLLDQRAEVRICMVLNVPPTLINSKIGLERAVESNVKEIQRNWWDNDLIPLYKHIGDSIRNSLLTLEYPDGLDLKWDFSDVPALQDDRDKTRQVALEALRSGAITRNQFLVEWGLPELGSRGDVFLMNSMTVEVPVSVMRTEIGSEGDDDAGGAGDDGSDDNNDYDSEPDGAGKSRPAQMKVVTFPPEKASAMRKVEGRIQTALTKYYKGLMKRLKESVQELTAHRNIKQNATQLPFWNGEQQVLFELLFPFFSDAIAGESQNAFDELAGLGNFGVSWEIVNDQAIGWAQNETTAVVSQISKTDMTGFVSEFDKWLNSGEPLDVLTQALLQYYSPVRAEMIAVTETTRAFHNANVGVWKQFEIVVGFDVLTAEDSDVDEICIAEQSRNPHALDEDGPPFHVRCRCGTRPVIRDGI